MSDRITVVFDDENMKLLRKIQGNMIVNSGKSVSFSRVVNIILTKGLQGAKIK